MLYHGFYINILPLKNIQREKKDGTVTECDGFQIEIFSDNSENILLDSFTHIGTTQYLQLLSLKHLHKVTKYPLFSHF
jgi:hypothetical protein